MNLETAIDPRLWKALQSSYEARQFTGAILDAVYFLADVVREKSGVSADGVSLVGQAFGGKNPLLKVNKLQTDTERSIQAGLEQLLKGIFQAVRNPRSHEKATDTQADANAIILFINHLISIIDKTRTVFSVDAFLAKVFDKNFVEKPRYAELLAQEVPGKQCLDILVQIYRAKQTGDGKKLRYTVAALLARLSEEEKVELASIVGNDLMGADDETDFRLTVQISPPELLSSLPEISRLRLENRLIKSVAVGRFDVKRDLILAGALGTWLEGRLEQLILRDELEAVICTKLRSKDIPEHDYLNRYLSRTVLHYALEPSRQLISAFRIALNAGSAGASRLLETLVFLDADKLGNALEKERKSFKERVIATDFDDDDIPF